MNRLAVTTVVSGGLVLKEISIRGLPWKVFRGLTRLSELNHWFTSGAKVDLRPGGRYSNDDHDRGRFLEIVPNRRVRFTWENPNHAAGSIVEVLLTPKGQKTILTLLHYDFKKKADLDHYGSRTSGWDWALENLKSHVEGGRIVQYEKWLENRS